MSLETLVDALAREGVRLWVEDGRVRYAGPTEALTPDRRQLLADRRDELTALLAGTTRPRTQYPASPWQLGLYLFEQQRVDGDDPYQEGVTLALSERVDPDRLAPAARALTLRHPALRASFRWTPDGLVSVIDPPGAPWVRIVEIPDVAAAGEAIRASRPGDLRTLFWMILLRAPDRDLLHVGGHHIAVDAGSLLTLCPLAVALLRGQTAESTQDMRYFRWLSELALPASDPPWAAELRGVDPALALPRSDHPARIEVPIELGRPTFDRIAAVARTLGNTRYELLLAAWAAVLHRFTGQEVVVVASPRSLRADADDGMVGYAVDTVPTAIAVQPTSTLRDLAAGIRASAAQVAACPHRPLTDVVARTEVVLAYQNLPGFKRLSGGTADRPRFAGGPTGLRTRIAGVDAELVHVPAAATKFPLELHLYELSDGLSGHLSLSGGFAPWLAPNLVEALTRTLATVDETLDTPIGRHRALRANPPTAIAGQAPPLAPGVLRAAWEVHAGAVAVDDGERTWTYAALSARRDGWASALLRAGVRPGDRVAVHLPRSLDLLAVIAAVWERGAVYVPLDTAWSAERIARCLRAAGVAFAISTGQALAGTRSIPAPDLADGHDAPVPVEPTPEALSHVYFTSGTTGEPKAVALCHEGLAEFLAWIGAAYAPAELAAVSCTSSPAFDFSLFELLAPSLAGGRVVCRASLHALLGAPPPGLTMLSAVPGVFTSALGRTGELPQDLRAVNFGGEALTRGLVRAVRTATSATLRNLYGPAEATMLVTCERVPADALTPSVGRAVGRNLVFVADPEGEPVLPGVRGEVVAIGPSVGRGYLNSEDPGGFFDAGFARGFRTGDFGHRDDAGRIHLVGRRDQRVKIRGVRLELAAVEDVVEDVPSVRRAAATYDGARLRVYVVVDGPMEGLADRIADHVRNTLVDAAVPDDLFRVEEFPVGTSGKVDADRLPAAVVEPLPRGTRRHIAPETALEHLVCLVWGEVLGLEAVGTEDDFFAIGGHSLAAVEVLATLERLLAVSVSAAEIQNLRTVARFCRRLIERSEGRDLENIANNVVRVLTMPEDELDATLNHAVKGETRHD